MNNELTLFPEMDMQEEGDIHSLPCYQGLSNESIDRLEQYITDIHNIANRASFELASVLCKARDEYRHNKHGGFEGWTDQRLKFSRRTAYNIIDRYEQFGTVQNFAQLDIVLSAQYQLSAPSVPQEAREEAIELAESGEKITVAKSNELIEKWKRIAEEKEKEAKDKQAKLDIFQSHSKLADDKIDELSQQITALEEKLRTAQTPEKEEVIPQETLDKIANQQALIKKLNEKNKFLHDETEKLTDELRKQRDANEARRKQEQYEFEIKNGWRKATDSLHKALHQFISSVPSPIAMQIFDGDDWARCDHVEDGVKHILHIMVKMQDARYKSQFVESVIASVPAIVEG